MRTKLAAVTVLVAAFMVFVAYCATNVYGHAAENDHTHEQLALFIEIRDLLVEANVLSAIEAEAAVANAEANRRIQLFTFYQYLANDFDPPGIPKESELSEPSSCRILHPCDFIKAVGATSDDLRLVGCESN
jgi:hypothetical protein